MCLSLAISSPGRLGGASAYALKADIQNGMAALALNPSAKPPKQDALHGFAKSRVMTHSGHFDFRTAASKACSARCGSSRPLA